MMPACYIDLLRSNVNRWYYAEYTCMLVFLKQNTCVNSHISKTKWLKYILKHDDFNRPSFWKRIIQRKWVLIKIERKKERERERERENKERVN